MEAGDRAMHGAIAEKSYAIERTLQSARFLPLVGMTKHAEQLQKSQLKALFKSVKGVSNK